MTTIYLSAGAFGSYGVSVLDIYIGAFVAAGAFVERNSE